MSEQESTIKEVIHKANADLDAAISYGEEIGATRVDRVNQTLDGTIQSAKTYKNGESTSISRGWNGTDVQVDSTVGEYQTTLAKDDTETISPLRASIRGIRTKASVERDGYGTHEFGEDKKVRAAGLIASLATKRFVNEADEKVTRMTDAQERYHSQVDATHSDEK